MACKSGVFQFKNPILSSKKITMCSHKALQTLFGHSCLPHVASFKTDIILLLLQISLNARTNTALFNFFHLIVLSGGGQGPLTAASWGMYCCRMAITKKQRQCTGRIWRNTKITAGRSSGFIKAFLTSRANPLKRTKC